MAPARSVAEVRDKRVPVASEESNIAKVAVQSNDQDVAELTQEQILEAYVLFAKKVTAEQLIALHTIFPGQRLAVRGLQHEVPVRAQNCENGMIFGQLDPHFRA